MALEEDQLVAMKFISNLKLFCNKIFKTPLEGDWLDAYENKSMNCYQVCIGVFLKVAIIESLAMTFVYCFQLSKMHLKPMYSVKLVDCGIFLALYLLHSNKVRNFDLYLAFGHIIYLIIYLENIVLLLNGNLLPYIFIQGVLFGLKSMFIFQFYKNFRVIIAALTVHMLYIYIRVDSDVFLVLLQLIFFILTYLFLCNRQFFFMKAF